MKKQKGITLIALVISIIVMLILAGVSINAIVGENGVLSRAQYTSFMSEMAAVEEAVQLWKAGELIESKGKVNTAIPANGLWEVDNINEDKMTEDKKRLVGEIGYYRDWNIKKEMPSADILSVDNTLYEAFKVEFVGYPAGVQDLYYLNNEALDLDKDKVYLIDAATSMVYSTTGITLNGVRCYSTSMAKAIMGNNVAPLFAEAEVSGGGNNIAYAGATYLKDKNGNYIDENGNIVNEENKVLNPNGFDIISDFSNDNIYKLYNNGDLYAKGIKGNLLNTSQEKLENIDSTEWQELIVPTQIGAYKKVIPGYECIYVIDNDDKLWAWGNNESNRFGLTKEQQVEYTGREAIKLNVDNKKVVKVFGVANATFAVTLDKGIYELYAAGYNVTGALGIGNTESQDKFSKCIGLSNPENLYSVELASNPKVTNLFVCKVEDEIEVYLSGLNAFEKDKGTNFLKITRILDGNYGEDLDQDIKQVKFWARNIVVLTKDGRLMLTNKEYAYISLKGLSNGMFTNTTFGMNDTENLNISNIYGGSSYHINIIERIDDSGNKFYYLYSIDGSWLGLESNSVIYDFTNDLPIELLEEGIRNIRITYRNIYIISNSGKVFATGEYKFLGLGKDIANNPIGFVNLTEETKKLKNSLPLIKDVCYWNNMETSTPMLTVFLEGADGKIYTTGNTELIFRDNVLEKAWTKIASDVKSFSAHTQTGSLAYVDKENNAWILGDNSLWLGVGATEKYSIKNFVKLNDYLQGENADNIKNNVDKIYCVTGATYILTLDKVLYVTGQTATSTWVGNYRIGIEEDNANFVKILENVELFSSKNYGKYAITKDADDKYHCYTWGLADSGGTIPGGHTTLPRELTDLPFDISNVKKISVTQRISYVITNDGELYVFGLNGTTGSAVNGLNQKVTVFTKFEQSTFNNEKIIDIQMADGNSNTAIVLTDVGNVYGWGALNNLGLGREEQTYQMTPIKLNISNVMSISGGDGFLTCIKKDGTVWGTGTNQYGILGRWIGIDRNSPNSRYKTAFNWVECPELEI